MTTFLDGPAQGQVLELRRAPYFLRVVSMPGKWDALDQLDDSPADGETICAYEIQGKPSMMHVRRSGGRGGWMIVADYALVKERPADSDMRTNAAWRAWCLERAKTVAKTEAGKDVKIPPAK